LSQKEKIQQKHFEKLFRDHFTGLSYFAQKYLGDLDSSKEIVHNVFLKIWENRDEFDWDKPAKSYLFTSVYNRCMNHIRDHKKFVSDEENSVIGNITDSYDHSEKMEVAELEGRIKQALGKLPEKCREVFEMSRFDGKKYSEIAGVLDISVKTVETQMSKALKVLREQLKDYLYILLIMILKNYDKL